MTCLYISGRLVNINGSMKNIWKSEGKVGESDEDWKVVTLLEMAVKMVCVYCNYYYYQLQLLTCAC